MAKEKKPSRAEMQAYSDSTAAKIKRRRAKRKAERGYEPLRYKFKTREGYTMGPSNISPRHRVIQEMKAKVKKKKKKGN